MLSKNNIKYILILALGFFWCSSVYLTQEQYLLKFADVDFVNIVELLFGSLSMALGILCFGLLYRKNIAIKKMYFLFTILSIISMATFFMTRNVYIMALCLSLTCFFGTAGFGAGYHFSLLSCNVEKEYRGRVFALGYGLGSIGTYLIVLLPEYVYTSAWSLVLYIPIVILTSILVMKNTKLEKIIDEKWTVNFKSYFFKISIIVLAMSLLSALSTDVIALHTIDIAGGYGKTRIYYCLGLLIAGILADKKSNIFEILTIISFIVSLLAIILLKENYSISLIAGLSYAFVAFFVLFRTMAFVNMDYRQKGALWLGAFGLMYSRIMEGLMVLFEDRLIENYTILIVIISIMLAIVIGLYFLIYYENKAFSIEDKIKQLSIKYKLSLQEERVLYMLVSGKNNQEIADLLFISVYTVKRHIASIYKKTNMKKAELVEKCFK